MINKDTDERTKISYGFLSSIEILIIEKVSLFQLQNIEHLHWLLNQLNQVPTHSETTSDFNQIRGYYFENLSKFFRQTIVYSEYLSAEVNSVLTSRAFNYKGTIREKVYYKNFIKDLLREENLQIECLRLDIQKFEDEYEQRYNYFMNQIWSKLRSARFQVQYVFFVSSYFEFVKLKKYFK